MLAILRCTYELDDQWEIYHMRNNVDGVLRTIDDITSKKLFKKFVSSNRATTTTMLKIIRLLELSDDNFDLHGYNAK